MFFLSQWPRSLYYRKLPSISLAWLTLIALFVMLPLASCGGASSQAPRVVKVSIVDYDFSPKQIHIHPGDTVSWTNNGQTAHTVTADDNSFDSSTLQVGKSFTHTFSKAGRYPYYCQFHGGAGGLGMAGVVIVDSSS